MAKVPPPKNKKAHTTPNLVRPSSSDTKPLQFKLSPEEHKEVKGYAMDHDLSMVALFRLMFEEYKRSHK